MGSRDLNPLISVVVPVYNEENYVGTCIESIVNQTYKNLEIILVDDSSTDLSGKICDEYAAKDSRIVVVHKENGGLVSSRKAGIQIARGDYAAYVDGDDWIEPDMYEKLIAQIGDADIIISGKIRDYENHSIYERNKIPDGIYEGSDLENKIYSRMMYNGKFYERGIAPQSYQNLYKLELLLKNQIQVPDSIHIGEDFACTYPTLLDANKIILTSDCFYHYRIREGSIMDMSGGGELERLRIVYRYLKSRFSEQGKLKRNLLEQLDYMMIYILLLKDIKSMQGASCIAPYSGIKEGDKLVVYGAGRFGKAFVHFVKEQKQYEIVSWVDSNGKMDDIEKLNDTEYDYIIIAALLQEAVDEIMRELRSMKIPDRKIKKIDMKEIEILKIKLGGIL